MASLEEIIEVAHEHFERTGRATRITDIANALAVKRSAILRQAGDKYQLYEKVVETRLRPELEELRGIAGREGPAALTLRRWFEALRDTRAERYLNQRPPSWVAGKFRREILRQLAGIIGRGIEVGELRKMDPRAAAHLALHAMNGFHGLSFLRHRCSLSAPCDELLQDDEDEDIDEDSFFDAAIAFVTSALEAPGPPQGGRRGPRSAAKNRL